MAQAKKAKSKVKKKSKSLKKAAPPRKKVSKAKKSKIAKSRPKAQISSLAVKKKTKNSSQSKSLKWDQFITPLDDRVIVSVEEAATQTPGGLYIPSTANADRPSRGRVLVVGRGHLDKKGRLKPMAVQIGDEVLFAAFSGTEMKLQGQEVLILREADLLGVVE